MRQTFIHRSPMSASAETVYAFHAEPGALQFLTPPWEKMEILAITGPISQRGSQVKLRIHLGPLSQTLIAENVAHEPNRMFRDKMIRSPFRFWEHTHLFLSESATTSFLEDRVDYELPLGWLGRLFAGAYTRRRLQRMFEWRHRVTAEAVAKRQNSKQDRT
jgi:ligand-binding SRPBCC domain-containing protein